MLQSEDIDYLQNLLIEYRSTLAIYIKQEAEHGFADVPPRIANGIIKTRAEIRRIKRELRASGVEVDDKYIDKSATETREVGVLTPFTQQSAKQEINYQNTGKSERVILKYYGYDHVENASLQAKEDEMVNAQKVRVYVPVIGNVLTYGHLPFVGKIPFGGIVNTILFFCFSVYSAIFFDLLGAKNQDISFSLNLIFSYIFGIALALVFLLLRIAISNKVLFWIFLIVFFVLGIFTGKNFVDSIGLSIFMPFFILIFLITIIQLKNIVVWINRKI